MVGNSSCFEIAEIHDFIDSSLSEYAK